MIDYIIHKNPRQLTSNQKKWIDRYLDKSGDEDDVYLEPPNDYHEVCEWNNGWIDFTVDNEIFWIWSMYCNDPDKNITMVETFKLAVDLAQQRNCEAIEWDTRRSVRAWQRLAKNIGKIKIVTRIHD